MVRIFLVVIGEPCGLFRGGGGAEVEVDGEGKQTTVGHSWATGCRSMVVSRCGSVERGGEERGGVSKIAHKGSLFIWIFCAPTY